MGDWETTTWGTVSTLHYGKALRGYQGDAGTTAVYASSGRVGSTDEAPLAVGPRPVVGRKGTLGVHLATGPFWVIDTAFWLEPKPGLDPKWAYQALRGVDWQGLRSGSSLPSLSREHFYDHALLVPPLEEQKRIAGVLGAFDDLIETDRRLAAQLDEARRSRVAAALAGSTFETCLSEVAAFVNGRNFTKGASGSGRPVIRTPEVRYGPVGNTVWSSVDAEADRVANAGDILFVWSGTLMVNRWLYTEGLVNQHVFKVIPNGVPDWYVYALIEAQLSWFLGLAKDKATTMGHIQRGHLDETMIGLDSNTIQSLGGVIEPLWSAALDLRIEAQNLARQRDELLPLLMSGKMRVRDVEAAVS